MEVFWKKHQRVKTTTDNRQQRKEKRKKKKRIKTEVKGYREIQNSEHELGTKNTDIKKQHIFVKSE